jgi:hypothetical protein
MVELFSHSNVMAFVNQLTPPLGAYVEGAVRGWCCRVLYNYANQPKIKSIEILKDFILLFCKLSKSNAPKAMESTPLHASPQLHRLFNNSSIFSSHFWLVVVCWFTNWRPIKATMDFIFIMFCVTPFNAPNDGMLSSHMLCPGRASFNSSYQPRLPTFGWLLRVAA